MNVKVLETGQVTRTLDIEVPKERVAQAVERELARMGRSAKIPGFRPGKAPRPVIEKSFGAAARHEAVEHLIPEVTFEALEQQKIPAIGRPRIEDLEVGEDLKVSFKALVEIKPAFELEGALSGLKLKAPKPVVAEAAVEAELKRLAENFATVGSPLDRPVKDGDWVLVDYVAKHGETPIPGGRAQRVPVEVGSGKSLPGFEQALLGLGKGGKTVVEVPYPADHPNPDLAGKTIAFTIHVHDVRERQLPPFDDELARQAGEFKTLDELKAKVRETLQAQAEANRRGQLAEQAGQELVDRHGFAAPAVMVDAEIEYLMDRERQNLEQRGMAFSQDPANLEALRKELRPQAEKRTRLTLVLEKIAEREKIEVSGDEYRQEMARFAKAMRASEQEVMQWASRSGREEGIKSRLRNDKAMAWVLDKAQVSEG